MTTGGVPGTTDTVGSRLPAGVMGERFVSEETNLSGRKGPVLGPSTGDFHSSRSSRVPDHQTRSGAERLVISFPVLDVSLHVSTLLTRPSWTAFRGDSVDDRGGTSVSTQSQHYDPGSLSFPSRPTSKGGGRDEVLLSAVDGSPGCARGRALSRRRRGVRQE